MSTFRSLARCLSVAAVTCCALIAAVPAQAAVIGSFDPAFGGSIANLGFRGTFELNVSQGCYDDGPGYVFTGGSCSITVQSLILNFYNINNHTNDPNPAPTIQSYNLSGTFSSTYIFGAEFDAQDHLIAFDSNDSDPFAVSVHDNTVGGSPINYDGTMLLYFVSGFEPECGDCIDPAFLVNCNTAVVGDGLTCSRFNGTNSGPATVSITTVPEPEMIPLALLGLVALAATRRRGQSLNRTRARARIRST